MIDHSIFLRTLKIDYDVIYPCLFSSVRKKIKNVEGIALIGYNKDQVKSQIWDYNLGRKECVCACLCEYYNISNKNIIPPNTIQVIFQFKSNDY